MVGVQSCDGETGSEPGLLEGWACEDSMLLYAGCPFGPFMEPENVRECC